jgi:hypothetical protein
VLELNHLELQFLKLNNFKLNVQVEELQQYGNQLLCHWIRENYSNKPYHKMYKPIIRYSTDHRSNSNNNNNNNHMLSNNNTNKLKTCSSNVLILTANDKSVSDTITRC